MIEKELVRVAKTYFKPKLKEFLTFDRDCGFNLVKAEDEIAAECISQAMVLDEVTEFDKELIEKVRELIKDD